MRKPISPSSLGGSLLVLALVAVGCGSTEQPEAPPGQPIGPKTQDDALLTALMEGGSTEPTAKATAEATAAPTATVAASAVPSGSAKPKGTAAPTAKPTAKPTAAPTTKPTAAPTAKTAAPTMK